MLDCESTVEFVKICPLLYSFLEPYKVFARVHDCKLTLTRSDMLSQLNYSLISLGAFFLFASCMHYQFSTCKSEDHAQYKILKADS